MINWRSGFQLIMRHSIPSLQPIRSFSSADNLLKGFQQTSKQRMRARKFAWLATTVLLPLSCLSLYARLSALPPPLDNHSFPLMARLHIYKAMLILKSKSDVEGVARELDAALEAVMAAGLGAASPQATALLVYLTQLYVSDSQSTPRKLEEALTALLHKPHVGEALAEEETRLKAGLQVVQRLHSMHSGTPRAEELLQRYESTIMRCPPNLSMRLQHHFHAFKTDLKYNTVTNKP